MFANKTPWIVLLVLWMIGSTWWHVCKIKQLCADDAPSAATTAAIALPGLTIADGDRFRLDLPGNFTFAKSGANANMNRLGGSLDSLTAYLKANPGRTLEITGYYASSEINNTSFANLGLARAEGIKQYLVQQGIPASSLTTKGVLLDSLTFTPKGDSLYGGLNFAFGGAALTAPAPVTISGPTTEDELAKAEKYTSVFKPIDLYFPLNEANYIKTPDTQKFFEEAVKYLNEHKDKKLLLTGHTDSSGPDDVNMRLSQDRANDVKAKLRKLGINGDQIETRAKGETQPKADNSTPSGRKANRRVTVVVE